MNPTHISHDDYRRIAEAIDWIDAHRQDQPDVAGMAQAVALSASHFSRLFRRWAGISPQRYLAQRTLADARDALAGSATVEEAAWGSGLSGPGRLHDLFVTIDAVTPGEYRRRGAGLALRWGFAPSPFGDALLAESDRGVVALRFGDPEARDARLAALQADWPAAGFAPLRDAPSRIDALFAPATRRVELLLAGTPFQHKVWQALVALEPGETVTYSGLATRIGSPSAARAVGGAVGANPVAVLIPCHRVLRADGRLGGYRWGTQRKRTVLEWERCRRLAAAESGVLSSATR